MVKVPESLREPWFWAGFLAALYGAMSGGLLGFVLGWIVFGHPA